MATLIALKWMAYPCALYFFSPFLNFNSIEICHELGYQLVTVETIFNFKINPWCRIIDKDNIKVIQHFIVLSRLIDYEKIWSWNAGFGMQCLYFCIDSQFCQLAHDLWKFMIFFLKKSQTLRNVNLKLKQGEYLWARYPGLDIISFIDDQLIIPSLWRIE